MSENGSESDFVLEIRGLARVIGGRKAVDGLDLRVGRSEVVCLLGPSGCGKSTTLRMIAGIERPDAGRIRLDGAEVSGPDRFVPPERRSVGLMFQDFALFPHLDVRRNVAFGLRNLRADWRRARVADLLGRVGLARHADKHPHELSGGEQQRVALARALAPSPRLMLMDEPFSGLDDRLRDDVREATLALLRESGTATLLVTHDPGEAMRVADRIALTREGRLVQVGTPLELYEHPVDRGTAQFFSDVNVLPGRVAGSSVETALGSFPAPRLHHDAAAEVIVRPQHVEIVSDDDTGRGVFARVERVRFVGRESLVDLRTESGISLRAALPQPLVAAPGTGLRCRVSAERAFVFPASPPKVATDLPG